MNHELKKILHFNSIISRRKLPWKPILGTPLYQHFTTPQIRPRYGPRFPEMSKRSPIRRDLGGTLKQGHESGFHLLRKSQRVPTGPLSPAPGCPLTSTSPKAHRRSTGPRACQTLTGPAPPAAPQQSLRPASRLRSSPLRHNQRGPDPGRPQQNPVTRTALILKSPGEIIPLSPQQSQ